MKHLFQRTFETRHCYEPRTSFDIGFSGQYGRYVARQCLVFARPLEIENSTGLLCLAAWPKLLGLIEIIQLISSFLDHATWYHMVYKLSIFLVAKTIFSLLGM